MQKSTDNGVGKPLTSRIAPTPAGKDRFHKTNRCRQVIERGKKIADEVKAEGLDISLQNYLDRLKNGRL